MSTSLLTNLAAVAVILSKTDQLARVATFQSPESSADEREEALTDLLSANVRLAHKVAKQHVRNGLDFQDLLAAMDARALPGACPGQRRPATLRLADF